jgi:hypothetical protein
MDVSCSEDDRQLFRASTRVTVGKGDRAEFWEAAWLQGRAPRDIAPLLYKFAWRKHQTVKDDLNNNKWTRMSSVAEMAELISLWIHDISSSLILVIHDNMIIGTNLIVLSCLYRHF